MKYLSRDENGPVEGLSTDKVNTLMETLGYTVATPEEATQEEATQEDTVVTEDSEEQSEDVLFYEWDDEVFALGNEVVSTDEGSYLSAFWVDGDDAKTLKESEEDLFVEAVALSEDEEYSLGDIFVDEEASEVYVQLITVEN